MSSITLVTQFILIQTTFPQLLGFLGSILLSGQDIFLWNGQSPQQYIVLVFLKTMGIFIQFFIFSPYMDIMSLHLPIHSLSFQQMIVFSLSMKLRISQLNMFTMGNSNTLESGLAILCLRVLGNQLNIFPMPLILFSTFLLILVLHEFDLPGMLPFWDPWSFCQWLHPCLGPQLVTFSIFFLFFAVVVVRFLDGEQYQIFSTLRSFFQVSDGFYFISIGFILKKLQHFKVFSIQKSKIFV